jgi:hypothetical protein
MPAGFYRRCGKQEKRLEKRKSAFFNFVCVAFHAYESSVVFFLSHIFGRYPFVCSHVTNTPTAKMTIQPKSIFCDCSDLLIMLIFFLPLLNLRHIFEG